MPAVTTLRAAMPSVVDIVAADVAATDVNTHSLTRLRRHPDLTTLLVHPFTATIGLVQRPRPFLSTATHVYLRSSDLLDSDCT